MIDGLVGFNARHGPPGRFQRLATFVRDGDGRIRGGAVGTLKWKWVFVSHLWVEEDLRGRGLGTRLMTALEQLARSHGAENIHLETLGFQAKDFYEGLGFRQFAELENYAGGHSRHFMWKPLEPLVVCRGIGSSSRAMSALSVDLYAFYARSWLSEGSAAASTPGDLFFGGRNFACNEPRATPA